MYEIYIITNTNTNKSYIGFTKRTSEVRFRVHLSEARRNLYGMYLHNSIRKHGDSAFIFRIVERCNDYESACTRERALISEFGTKAPQGYNEHDGGSGGCKNASPDLRRKLSESMRGRVANNKGARMSEDQKAKISAANKGRKLTAEHLRKIAETKERKRTERLNAPKSK